MMGCEEASAEIEIFLLSHHPINWLGDVGCAHGDPWRLTFARHCGAYMPRCRSVGAVQSVSLRGFCILIIVPRCGVKAHKIPFGKLYKKNPCRGVEEELLHCTCDQQKLPTDVHRRSARLFPLPHLHAWTSTAEILSPFLRIRPFRIIPDHFGVGSSGTAPGIAHFSIFLAVLIQFQPLSVVPGSHSSSEIPYVPVHYQLRHLHSSWEKSPSKLSKLSFQSTTSLSPLELAGLDSLLSTAGRVRV